MPTFVHLLTRVVNLDHVVSAWPPRHPERLPPPGDLRVQTTVEEFGLDGDDAALLQAALYAARWIPSPTTPKGEQEELVKMLKRVVGWFGHEENASAVEENLVRDARALLARVGGSTP